MKNGHLPPPVKRAWRLSYPLLALLVALWCPVTSSAQQISVNPDNYQQALRGTGGAEGKNPGHYNTQISSIQRDTARNWLTRDLPFLTYRSYQGGKSPYNEQAEWQRFIDMYLDLKSADPNIEFHLVMMQTAKAYETQLAQGNVPDSVFDAIGDIYFEALEYLKINGVTAAGLELLNEPGGQSVISTFAPLFGKPIDRLRNTINSPANVNNVPMPKIIGPSTFGTGQLVNWVNEMKANHQAAWNNIDILSTHNYGLGTVTANYSDANSKKEGRPFILNESTGKAQEDDVLTAGEAGDFTGALVVGYKLCAALNGGIEEYYAFQATGKNNNVPLVSIFQEGTNWEIARPSQHWTYRHFMSLPPANARVVTYTGFGYDANYLWTASLRKEGQDTVYVNVINLRNRAETLTLDMGSNYGIAAMKHLVSDTTGNRLATLSNTTFPSPVASASATLPAYSVSTFKVALGAPPAVPAGVNIQHKTSGNYLDGNGASSDAELNSLASASNPDWELIDAGSGYVYIENIGLNLRLWASNDGSQVELRSTSNSGGNVQWKIEAINSTYSYIIHKRSGRKLHAKSSTGYDVRTAVASSTGDNVQFSFTSSPGARKAALERPQNTGQSEPQGNNTNLVFYPNPTTGLIEIVGQNVPGYLVTNAQGVKIMEGKGNRVNLDQVPNGLYLIRVITNKNEEFTRKVIKE